MPQPYVDPNAPVIAVIGGGPSGLMAAETLAEKGWAVEVYDAMPSVGRKFLLAGVGGMNITHSEPFDAFLDRYRHRRDAVEPWLRALPPDGLRQWVQGLGIETFVGSSGRVFPRAMKAAPLLRAWLHRLRAAGVRFHVRHRWQGWDESGALCFSRGRRDSADAVPVQVRARAVVLALGGGSWARLGSDGAWVPLLGQAGVAIAPLLPANSGFEVRWTAHFRDRFAGQPLKPVGLRHRCADGTVAQQVGEIMISREGIEGGLVYALSAALRETLAVDGEARIELDLAPDWSVERLTRELARPRGSRSMANHLRSRVRLQGVKAGLLREVVPAADFAEPARLAQAIKALPLRLSATRPLDEAISTAGGVAFEALDRHLMLKAMPGVFCAGEMIDWEAPTGGYLLTACFASGRAAGVGADAWLADNG